MKYYYLAVGLAGMAAVSYFAFTYPAGPSWVAGIAAGTVGYACGIPIAIAVTMHVRKRRK